MKSKITIITTTFISFYCHSQTTTPTVINSSGGSSKQGYYQFEWSVGELALVNEMKNNIIVTNGFLQPYLLHPNSYNTNEQFGPDEIKVFPNPASSYVEINFFTKKKGTMNLFFYDALGQKIYSNTFNSVGLDHIERIPVSNLRAGTYMLYIELNNGDLTIKKGTFKIIKAE